MSTRDHREPNAHTETASTYDRLSRWYDLFGRSEKPFREAGLRALSVQPGERIIEIGPGTGASLLQIVEATGKDGMTVGIDRSMGMLRQSLSKLRTQASSPSWALIQGDGLCLPIATTRMDAIFISFTLELFDPDEIKILLDECQRVLHPGGRVGVVSLLKKNTLAVSIYESFHQAFPRWIDCRPIQPEAFLVQAGFWITHSEAMLMWGLPVQIVIARV